MLSWLLSLPSGWTRYGYENDDEAPILRTVSEAVCDLVAHDSWQTGHKTLARPW
jgi:hypothetical protein